LKLHNEIATTTLNYELKIHHNTFRLLKEAIEKNKNQNSQENGGFFIYEKMHPDAQSIKGENGSLQNHRHGI